MKIRKVWIYIILAILVISFFVISGNSHVNSLKINITDQSVRENAKVVRVIDGDTIEVSLNNKKEMVRLIGIDAPETVDPRKTVECFGKEASNKAKEMLDGKTITLESDPTQGNRDKYQRLLRYVFINHLNFNKLMISEGYAHEYTYQSNPYKYQLEFIIAEKSARESKVGLWSDVVKCNYE